jgi:hypothetical protein
MLAASTLATLILAGSGCGASGARGSRIDADASVQTARGYILTEKPVENGAKQIDLYAFEIEGSLPGASAGGGVQPVPATLFPAEGAKPSARRSVFLGEVDGQLRQLPLAEADVFFHITDDPEGLVRELKVLAEVKSLLEEPAREKTAEPPLRLNSLLNRDLARSLERRRDLKRELALARAKAEAAAELIARAQGDRAALEAALTEAQSHVRALEDVLAQNDALGRVAKALDAVSPLEAQR